MKEDKLLFQRSLKANCSVKIQARGTYGSSPRSKIAGENEKAKDERWGKLC